MVAVEGQVAVQEQQRSAADPIRAASRAAAAVGEEYRAKAGEAGRCGGAPMAAPHRDSTVGVGVRSAGLPARTEPRDWMVRSALADGSRSEAAAVLSDSVAETRRNQKANAGRSSS